MGWEHQKVQKGPLRVYCICETLSDATVESGRVAPRFTSSDGIRCSQHCFASIVFCSFRPENNVSVNIASRTLNSMEYARQTSLQSHEALLVANNAVGLISSFDLRI